MSLVTLETSTGAQTYFASVSTGPEGDPHVMLVGDTCTAVIKQEQYEKDGGCSDSHLPLGELVAAQDIKVIAIYHTLEEFQQS